MINTVTRLLIMGSLVSLVACSSDSGTTAAAATTTGETLLTVFSESSQSTATAIDVTGAWVSDCYLDNTKAKYVRDQNTFQNIDGETFFSASLLVHSDPADTTCAASFTSVQIVNSTIIISNNTKTITGWVDDLGNPAAALARADGAGDLTAQATVSRLDIGTSDKDVIYVDDTAIPWIMYHSGQTTGADGYPDALINFDKLTKF